MQLVCGSGDVDCIICMSRSLLLPHAKPAVLAARGRPSVASPLYLAGAEELQFVLVLRDYDHLLTAAAPETVVKTNMSQSLVGHRMAFQVKLRNGSHTTKLVSFADGKMLAMSVLAINLGPDDDMNEKVQSLCYTTQRLLQPCGAIDVTRSACCSVCLSSEQCVAAQVCPGLLPASCRCMATTIGQRMRPRYWTAACAPRTSSMCSSTSCRASSLTMRQCGLHPTCHCRTAGRHLATDDGAHHC
jgi:hypothetical protein